ncbi:Dpy-30 motif-containing protein [Spironucleus salmonicida]|uniref:Dpy-30 motif-containing protein n=1 Tax=Spironucleus salmonicida TaxID=348837 RepID=V6LSQ8_9EUKA|nr:Dpy-30 motif-containing protein [Spironucleus salmonicida]|eukprot:EST43824.1 hypothetical protein SS50377_16446 [Spironucleus salmonicida]
MKRVFISHLDTSTGKACAHVFRCFGYEIYGTLQDNDDSVPAPVDAAQIVPPPTSDYETFKQQILSCSVIVYDLLTPKEAVTAFEIVSKSPNQRKMICISTFMTWARTELPPLGEQEPDPLDEDEDTLPNEKEMEPEEVAELYKQAKQETPQWILDKIKEIKRKKREEEEGEEEAVEEEAPSNPEPVEDAAKEPEEDQETPEEPEEDLEELEDLEVPDEEELLLALPTYGITEQDFQNRRPHPDFRAHLAAENNIIQILSTSENLTGAIVTPGIIYGYGETSLAPLFRKIYAQEIQKAPLFYGGHQRSLPFVHALDLAILVHSLTQEAQPPKEFPFVFAVQRQQITAREFAEILGLKLFLDDPKREEIALQQREIALKIKPKPLTLQTFKLWKARRTAPKSLPKYVKEYGKTETLTTENAISELLQNVPMVPGFACSEILNAKWPLFARKGVLENLELAFSEYLAAWGLKPVRIMIQTRPDCKITLGKEIGVFLSKMLSVDPRDDGRQKNAFLTDLANSVGRQREEQTENAFFAAEDDPKSVKIVDCQLYDKLSLESLFEKLALDRNIRNRGFVLINLPIDVFVDEMFGKPAISNVFERYADLGLKEAKKKRKTDENDEIDEIEEEEIPEWLNEPDVQIDEEEKIQRVRERILVPYTAPQEIFTFGKQGLQKLADPPHDKYEFYDANICLEHPEGFRIPYPDYLIDLTKILRYEQAPEASFNDFFVRSEEKALQIYKEREFNRLSNVRKEYILRVKNQLIKVINKQAEKSGEAEYDEEGYNWVENYNLQGLNPKIDLPNFPIPKKEGLPEDPEPEEPAEEGEEVEPVVKEINPEDYNLGLEDEQVYILRRQEQAERRASRKQRNQSRKDREQNGDENISDLEEEKSEPQMDENGKELRMQPKLRPFLNVPKVPKTIDNVKVPEKTLHGFIYHMLEYINSQSKIKLLTPSNSQHFSEIALETAQFIGPSRGFQRTKKERKEQLERERLMQEIQKRIEEEEKMREAEAKRIAEELRIKELKELREKYVKDEERRVLDLSIPLRKYISITVLGDLLDGLIEVSKIRPSDPIRFLGEFLLDRSVKDIE